VYDGTLKSATVTTVPEGLNVILSYSANPINAGVYEVTATPENPNYSGNVIASLIIEKANAIVTADFKVIKQGDLLPPLTATFSGFVNGENQSVVNSLTFTVDPNYTGNPGTYQIIPFATATNYDFFAVNANLYVNPYGANAQLVLLSLDCVEKIPPDENGFEYIAHFSYQNSNATDLYIPIGTDNTVIGYGGNFSPEDQPVLFLTGGGSFNVRFDGVQIRWRVKSYNGFIKQAVTATAKKTSPSCSFSLDAFKSTEVDTEPTNEIIAFPNPASEKVFISLGDYTVSEKDVKIYNLFGNMCQTKITNASETTMELDFSAFEAGVYIIRLKLENELKTFRIIKN
jgi:hypothetical protein